MKEYKFRINGNTYDVTVNGIEGRTASVTVNGRNYDVEIDNSAAETAAATVAAPVKVNEAAVMAASGIVGKVVKSPLPGIIIDMCVCEGQNVHRGQKLAVLEAMKMENEILSERDGTVKEVFVQRGDSVLEGAKIVSIG